MRCGKRSTFAREIVKLAWYKDENFVNIYVCYFANPLDEHELTCFNERQRHKEKLCYYG